MIVSGFTIIRNGVKFAYPFKEAILSILPLCDEFIINVGISDDGTLKMVEGLKDDRIRVLQRQWDMSLRKDGELLSVETNHALKECKGDWCFYIQSDEVLHERYIHPVRTVMERYLSETTVEGISFSYKHFYGSYDYYQDNYRKWYVRQVRIVRNKSDIVSWGDAMDFKHLDGSRIKAINSNAEIYHYGHVRPPSAMIEKMVSFYKLYHNDSDVDVLENSYQLYDDLGNLKKFKGTHPSVMADRINESNWEFDSKLDEQLPDWLRAILIFLFPLTKRMKRIFGKKVA